MKNYFKVSVLFLCMAFALVSCRNEQKESNKVEDTMENMDSDADIKVKEDKIKMEDENTKVKIKTDETTGEVEKIKTKETE